MLKFAPSPDSAGDVISSGEDKAETRFDLAPSKRELDAKVQCASTLLAWSRHKDNAQRLAKVRKYAIHPVFFQTTAPSLGVSEEHTSPSRLTHAPQKSE